ncbi:MAG: molybdopterin-dependent oxidoreductase [Dehalococcoidales bacterium]|nr:molybdopterin-dependent oxidoreductase [Dehalococcoidales bacterium]
MNGRDRETSIIKGLGFIASSSGDANTSVVDVKDGRIVRIRPLHFDWKYDSKTFNPWQMKARGSTFEPLMKSLIPPYSLAYKNRVYSPNRILYPLKRVDWDPEGQRNTGNRGHSSYIRISWDEALDIIVREIRRVIDKYGSQAILSQQDGHGENKVVHGTHGCQYKLLNLLGGPTVQIRNADSWEGWYWGAKHAWGMEPVGQLEPVINVMPDIAQHTGLLLFWGCDPETTPWAFDGQMASRLCFWWSSLGIRSVFISPDLNYGAAVHADKWIPILPNTDAALQLAIAHVWIAEGLYDKDYVNTHTFGFDKFSGYVMGKEDCVPKTPAWAASRCGVPEWTIKALARDWASRATTIAHGNGGPGIRGPYTSENGRLEVLLLAMQGLGKAGAYQVKMLEWGRRSVNDSDPMPLGTKIPKVISVYTGAMNFNTAGRSGTNPGTTPKDVTGGINVPRQFIPKNLIHEAILNPPISWYGTTSATSPLEDQFTRYTYPAEGCPEVHMIWTDTPCWITCWNDSNSYIRALQSPKIEFMLAQHPWMENDCLFADIILPVSTKFEEQDIGTDSMGGQFRLIINEKQCIEPLGESSSDYEIVCMIAEKMGLLNEYTGGKTVEDLIRSGFDNSGVKEVITWDEFREKGYYVLPTDPGWMNYPAGPSGFYNDPEKNPLKTPSGKIEFYSQNLAVHFPGDKERPPVPHWIEKGESHNESLSGDRAGKYPLLIVSNHGRWRVHANHDDMVWTREIPTCKVKGFDGYKYEPLWINPLDAAARNIENGDVVSVYNERGAVLAGARVTERIRPGAVYMDHGARYDPIIPGELDRGGAINTLSPHNTTSKNATGMVASGYLVEVEKVGWSRMEGWKKQYPEAFKRAYGAESGLRFDARVVR